MNDLRSTQFSSDLGKLTVSTEAGSKRRARIQPIAAHALLSI